MQLLKLLKLLKMRSFPGKPKVRDGPGLPRDHSHFPESEEMETVI